MKTFLSLLVIASLAGCIHSAKESSAKGSRTKPKVIDGLELVLKADKAVYKLREPITLQLTVTNKRDEEIIETFRSAQTHDFVAKKDSKVIWRWAHNRMFAMMLQEFALEPEESITYKETWNQKGNNGNFVSLGKYKLIGILKTKPERLSLSLSIEVRAN